MKVTVRGFEERDVDQMIKIWNEVVEEGNSFPQMETLTPEGGAAFFREQTWCGVAQDAESGNVVGMYILHPNNVGRCGHICNASYGVTSGSRGNGVGKALVEDSLKRAKDHGFRIMQFNAVVSVNTGARRLYEKLGFLPLGTIPGGFLMKDGNYEDIVLYYHSL